MIQNRQCRTLALDAYILYFMFVPNISSAKAWELNVNQRQQISNGEFELKILTNFDKWN